MSTCLLISMLYVLSLVVRTSGQKHLLRWKISKLIENYSILYLTNNTNDPNSGSPTDTKISSNLSIDSNSAPFNSVCARHSRMWLEIERFSSYLQVESRYGSHSEEGDHNQM